MSIQDWYELTQELLYQYKNRSMQAELSSTLPNLFLYWCKMVCIDTRQLCIDPRAFVTIQRLSSSEFQWLMYICIDAKWHVSTQKTYVSMHGCMCRCKRTYKILCVDPKHIWVDSYCVKTVFMDSEKCMHRYNHVWVDTKGWWMTNMVFWPLLCMSYKYICIIDTRFDRKKA